MTDCVVYGLEIHTSLFAYTSHAFILGITKGSFLPEANLNLCLSPLCLYKLLFPAKNRSLYLVSPDSDGRCLKKQKLFHCL